MTKASRRMERPRMNLTKEAQARRDYQRRYYRAHKEKAKAYQKIWGAKYRKKKGNNPNRKALHQWVRPAVQGTFSPVDLRNLHGDKLVRTVNRILSGEGLFTM